jgi:hypothetical protein
MANKETTMDNATRGTTIDGLDVNWVGKKADNCKHGVVRYWSFSKNQIEIGD